jgi:hypothetical protein
VPTTAGGGVLIALEWILIAFFGKIFTTCLPADADWCEEARETLTLKSPAGQMNENFSAFACSRLLAQPSRKKW